jgi:glycosyltransferase involved in cell wall biosynthesis
LNENIGQQSAIRVGLNHAKSNAVAVMDADLQDPPEAIADLYRALGVGGGEAVFAERSANYQSASRMISSRFFKWIVRRIVSLPKGTGSFLIMSRTMVTEVLSFGTVRFYLPGLIAKTNLPIDTIPLHRAMRASGKSTYDSSLRIRTAVSNIKCLLERK